jgi:ATP adenylyltransferase
MDSTHPGRLWAPWRMKYIAHESIEDGCIFCNRLATEDDTKSLILRRTDHAFVIMNLYPYNTGHVMIVPNRHVADPGDLTPDELGALGTLLPETLNALRRVLNPAGFNIGMNIGAVAGAGVADHLHQHVVPRWQGDANFMPILAGAMVIPELIPATYAKIRAEIERPLLPENNHPLAQVIMSCDSSHVLVTKNCRLPTVEANHNEPVFAKAGAFVKSLGISIDLVGWAGNPSAKSPDRPAFAFLVSSTSATDGELRWIPVETAAKELRSKADRETLQHALNLDLSIASAPPR